MCVGEPLPVSLIKQFTINLDGQQLRTIPARGPEDREAAAQRPEDQHPYLLSPSLPNILQFLAPTLPLTAFTISRDVDYISTHGAVYSLTRRAVWPILDSRGKRCGLWWEQLGWGYVGRGISPEAEKEMVLVGLSRHENATTARRGPYRVEGEIPLFDNEVYPDVGEGSGLVNFVAVDLDTGHEFGERIIAGRIHEKAWEEAGPTMRMTRLA